MALEQPSPELQRRKEQLKDFKIAGPPKLKLRLVKRIQFLLLANILPIGVGAWLAWGYYNGTVQFAEFDRFGFLATIVIMVVSCGILVATTWVILPFARWLRDYPNWHFERRSQIVWAVPAALGWVAWLFAWIGTAVGGIIAVGLIIVGLLELFNITQQSQQTPPAESTTSEVIEEPKTPTE